MNRPHTTWLALPLALVANALWFGLLAAAQHRPAPPVFHPAVPEPHVIYEALHPPAPGAEVRSSELSSPTTFLMPSILPNQETQSEPLWLAPALRLTRDIPSVSLVFAPPAFAIAPPATASANTEAPGSAVDQLPMLVSGTPPDYPGWARRAELAGHVQLRFVVTAAGRVQDIEVLYTEGDTRFGPHAARKISSWRFEPARKNGRAVTFRCLQTVHYQSRP